MRLTRPGAAASQRGACPKHLVKRAELCSAIASSIGARRIKTPAAGHNGIIMPPCYADALQRNRSAFLRNSGTSSSTEVIRGVAGLPLDVAPDTGFLIRRDRLAGQHGIECRAQVLSGHGNAAARAAVIHLPAINESLILIEKEEVGGARGAIGLSHFLRLV